MKIIFKILSVFCFIGILSSCTHNTDVSSLNEVSFKSEVLPIFQSNCTMSGCHGSGGEEQEVFDATNYNGILKKITPNSLTDSEVYSVITNAYSIMPPSPYKSLTKDQRTTIEVWILQGAKNN